jgi:hypothetical protein
MYNLGAIYANRGNFEEAAAWWQKVKDQTADADLATRAMHSLLQIQKSP